MATLGHQCRKRSCSHLPYLYYFTRIFPYLTPPLGWWLPWPLLVVVLPAAAAIHSLPLACLLKNTELQAWHWGETKANAMWTSVGVVCGVWRVKWRGLSKVKCDRATGGQAMSWSMRAWQSDLLACSHPPYAAWRLMISSSCLRGEMDSAAEAQCHPQWEAAVWGAQHLWGSREHTNENESEPARQRPCEPLTPSLPLQAWAHWECGNDANFTWLVLFRRLLRSGQTWDSLQNSFIQTSHQLTGMTTSKTGSVVTCSSSDLAVIRSTRQVACSSLSQRSVTITESVRVLLPFKGELPDCYQRFVFQISFCFLIFCLFWVRTLNNVPVVSHSMLPSTVWDSSISHTLNKMLLRKRFSLHTSSRETATSFGVDTLDEATPAIWTFQSHPTSLVPLWRNYSFCQDWQVLCFGKLLQDST